MGPSFYGIRHHGPGSARSLLDALEEQHPDVVLIEGPPEVEAILRFISSHDFVPPVAILAYLESDPNQAMFYPYAEFSPEWVAIKWALEHRIPIKMIDLPAAVVLSPKVGGLFDTVERRSNPGDKLDPLGMLAKEAGFEDGERWWDRLVESRHGGTEVFQAIAELMSAAREEIGEPTEIRELQREAAMRQGVREALGSGHRNPAVILGAMHIPAVARYASITAKEDAALLKGLERSKVKVTWVPWSYNRIAAASGYGAGVVSPAYYEHLWRTDPKDRSTGWILRAARLLRENDLSASTADAIEAVRLTDALAAIRGRSEPGLEELCDATQTVLAGGRTAPMELIRRRLIVGEAIGHVPAQVPGLPLEQDFRAEQTRLKLKPKAEVHTLKLDLRNTSDLERSRFLHRLRLLDIPWGTPRVVEGSKGTFHDHWEMDWHPEFSIRIVEASLFGASVLEAATNRVLENTAGEHSLSRLTDVLESVLLGDLPGALGTVLFRLERAAAQAADVQQLLEAIPPVGEAIRYGSLRLANVEPLNRVFAGLVARACVSLPAAASQMGAELSEEVARLLEQVDGSMTLREDTVLLGLWNTALHRLLDQTSGSGLLPGRVCQLLFRSQELGAEDTGVRLARVLSPGTPHAFAAEWIEGFFSGNGTAITHHDTLFGLVDGWVIDLESEAFFATLPLLRRTFAQFQPAEIRALSSKIAGAHQKGSSERVRDPELVAMLMPMLRKIRGEVSHGA